MKRLLMLFLMIICLVFIGAQSAPTAKATGVSSDLVCGDPYIDPIDGKCYQICCPSDPLEKGECVRRPCLE